MNMTDLVQPIRHDWTLTQIKALFAKPFNDLLFQAQTTHRRYFDPNAVQISTLLSIKTGACPEDCSYCPQSARYDTGLERESLLSLEAVKQAATNAKSNGASRFCMGAAWRNPTDKNLDRVIEMISLVKDLGLETCVTLGMLTQSQTRKLKAAGLDYYNHNLDTSPEYYKEIITTRTYQDRLDTLENVRAENINVCSGGIIGMGETHNDRAGLLQQLANLPQHPQSVPINLLVQVENTPLYGTAELDPIEFARTIAVARIIMPKSTVRLSAGRNDMSEEMQALCFLAGANSIFYGDKLLTTPNPDENKDLELFEKLGINASGKLRSDSSETAAA
jgi:biotin synthase